MAQGGCWHARSTVACNHCAVGSAGCRQTEYIGFKWIVIVDGVGVTPLPSAESCIRSLEDALFTMPFLEVAVLTMVSLTISLPDSAACQQTAHNCVKLSFVHGHAHSSAIINCFSRPKASLKPARPWCQQQPAPGEGPWSGRSAALLKQLKPSCSQACSTSAACPCTAAGLTAAVQTSCTQGQAPQGCRARAPHRVP